MYRVIFPAFVILFFNLFVAMDTASIPRSTRSTTYRRPSTKMLREFSYKFNPREMIEHVFQINKVDAYAKFHQVYNKNRDTSAQLSATGAEILLDDLSSATSQTMCRKPLPKVANLYEMLDPGPNVVLSPAGIAVHACSQDSGCCPPGEECVGVEFRTKNFTYLHVENEVLTVQSHQVIEDHRCTCRPVNNEVDPSQISGHYSSVQIEEEPCEGNQVYDQITGSCRCAHNFCASGTVLNEFLCQCEEIIDEPETIEECPQGKIYDAEFGRCVCIFPCPTGTILNHLNCTCEDARKTPSSNVCGFNRCPKPFNILNETTCKCECEGDDKNCDKMRKGTKKLNEKHCINVRLGTQGTPTCKERMHFDTDTCQCEEELLVL